MSNPSIEHSAVTTAGAAVHKSPVMTDAVQRALAGYDFVGAKTKQLTAEEVGQIRSDLVALRAQQTQQYLRNLPTGADSFERALIVLRRASTYRSRTGFADPATWSDMRGQLQVAASEASPLVLALPIGGGKAPNPTKTGAHYLPDLAEWTSWSMLAALADALGAALGRDVRVLLIPDAGLHTADLALAGAEVLAHVRQADQDLRWLDIHNVVVAETLQHLPAAWPEEVAHRAELAAERIERDSSARASAEAQAAALLFSVNTRSASWSFARQVLVTAALGDERLLVPNDVRADAEDLRRQVRRVTPHYIGVNHALRSLAVPQHIAARLFNVPRVLRMTVHAKPGEARPSLLPDSHLARPGLLPMHGLGVVGPTRRFLMATEFELEARMAGHQPLALGGRFLGYLAHAADIDTAKAQAA